MMLFERVKNLVAAATATEAAVPGAAELALEKQTEIAGLNFMEAVDAHMKWKMRLGAYIRGNAAEELKVETVARDDLCNLGRWIHGTGAQRYHAVETFGELKRAHAEFHRCAGGVLATAQNGQKEAALDMLQHGVYLRNSERVKVLLAKLYVQLSEKRKQEA